MIPTKMVWNVSSTQTLEISINRTATSPWCPQRSMYVSVQEYINVQGGTDAQDENYTEI